MRARGREKRMTLQGAGHKRTCVQGCALIRDEYHLSSLFDWELLCILYKIDSSVFAHLQWVVLFRVKHMRVKHQQGSITLLLSWSAQL